MKKIITLSKIILGTGLLLFAMNSCKQEPKLEEPKEAAEEINDQKIENEDAEDDADYLVDVAEINIFEIEIGKLALQKGVSPEVKKLAQALVTDHTQSLEELKELANKKAITLPAEISEDGLKEYNELKAKTGADFDKKFSELMADGHEKAVDKMTEISQKAKDADIKLWTSRQVSTFTEHHEEAKKLDKKNQ
jgi:putative membrane protein